MKHALTSAIFLLVFSFGFSQNIQSPSEFLGYEIGTQFTRHADIVNYFNQVTETSALVTYHNYGQTNERRQLTYAVVTSESNQNNIETIRLNNLKQIGLADGSASPEVAIVWLSYNVHGNEASSAEAAMQTVYELITQKQAWLENTVVIIDPNLNPDGRDRYVNWYNQVKSTPYNSAQVAAEHMEPWPGGRPNHYLFDLNRDWAWATQVETQQRLKVYNQWMPHIHVDFHEQGINEPYYFAPAAEPFHEIISDWQRDFQIQIGQNHAGYFDKEGWLFFTRERFDLLYPSYGDTYPTYVGAIGMTYEQAGHGRAGLGIDTDEGYELTLVDRVEHQKTTGLSTVEISSKNAKRLNTEFQKFFQPNLKYKSFVLQGEEDKVNALVQLLDLHEIKYGFANSGKATGFHYGTNKNGSLEMKNALVVNTNQPKGRMVQALFEPETKLSTPLTYDITAWNLPHAYGLEAIASTTLVNTSSTMTSSQHTNTPNPGAAGYIAKWSSMQDATFLAELLQEGIKVRFSEKKFGVSGQTFDRGSLIITKSDNRNNPEFNEQVTEIANKHNRKLFASSTSFSDTGTDFGSPDVKIIHAPRIALLKGNYTSSLSYGALWHFFEQQLHYPATSIDTDYFKNITLDQFDVLILPSGYYQSYLDESALTKIKEWVSEGGTLVAIDNALSTFADKDGFGLKRNSPDEEDKAAPNLLIPYDQREQESVKNFITGTIFKTKVDVSHPLAFGYDENYFTLKAGRSSYSFLENGYNVAYIEGEAERVSGFAGEEALKGLQNSLVFGEHRMGKGSIIYLADDVMFRSFWENGKLFFVNSLFFINNKVVVF
ncbi:M14 family metallopeptidase [Planktosalinus lacus]|uniref:Peptidase M14 n=1 Tax=Planktosalinus lacus TaxID=1526573 RepID=A0A8J2V7R7_9FLAO|nr:M14 family zinc carboxypeptidase [Planktosalinus lacus]GGD85251.1 peptidase M14 [Planktosalinus lacus]